MQKALSLAKQRRNATTAAAGLPAELLAMIFTIAAKSWVPIDTKGWFRRRVRDTNKETLPRYDLGWLHITHVCSSWRKVHSHVVSRLDGLLTSFVGCYLLSAPLERAQLLRASPTVYG